MAPDGSAKESLSSVQSFLHWVAMRPNLSARLGALLARACPIALVLLSLGSGGAAAVETVRIAIGNQSDSVTLSGPGLQVGEDDEEAEFHPVEREIATVRLEGGKLRREGAALQEEAVRFRLTSSDGPGSDAGNSARILVGKQAFEGEVVVRAGRNGLLAINVLPLERYLTGVLKGEMPASFPLEARKAQAVAARTYALYRKLEALDEPVHMGSDVLSQVYSAAGGSDASAREAVEATRGLVLTYRLLPVEAYFHSSCGGRTENGLEALSRERPYLKPVDCPCGKLPSSQWRYVLSNAELMRLFGPGVSGEKLAMVGRTATGRAARIDLGLSEAVEAVTFRQRVGYSKVKSLWFDATADGSGGVVLTGRGFGHGAGLCQWGAKVLADQDWDFRRILAHYYRGTEVQPLY
jgi:stage II sporulation protein D